MYWGSDAPDDRMLLSLDLKEPVQELSMMRTQLANVVEDVLDEGIQPFRGDDERVDRT